MRLFGQSKLNKAIAGKLKEIFAKGITEGAKDTSLGIKRSGQQRVVSAGYPNMSPRMAKAWKSESYPEKGASFSPSITAAHVAPYSKIFETGSTRIGPKRSRFMWLPFPGSPAEKLYRKKGQSAEQAKFFESRLGLKGVAERLGVDRLRYVRRPGKPPLLVGSVRVVGKQGKMSKTTRSNRRAIGQDRPLFIGLTRVVVPGRWEMGKMIKSELNKSPSRIMANLKKVR